MFVNCSKISSRIFCGVFISYFGCRKSPMRSWEQVTILYCWTTKFTRNSYTYVFFVNFLTRAGLPNKFTGSLPLIAYKKEAVPLNSIQKDIVGRKQNYFYCSIFTGKSFPSKRQYLKFLVATLGIGEILPLWNRELAILILLFLNLFKEV